MAFQEMNITPMEYRTSPNSAQVGHRMRRRLCRRGDSVMRSMYDSHSFEPANLCVGAALTRVSFEKGC